MDTNQVLNIAIIVLVIVVILYLLGYVPMNKPAASGFADFGDGTVPLVGGLVSRYDQVTTDQLVRHDTDGTQKVSTFVSVPANNFGSASLIDTY